MGSAKTGYNKAAVVWAVNVGGAQHTAIDGVHYVADDMIIGGEPGSIAEVIGAQDSVIYQSYRMGDIKIRHLIANGVYDITFEFAEPENVSVGERVFDLVVQGQKVIEALDIRLARGGNQPRALKHSVTGVVVSDGQLDIQFHARSGRPVLSGLVVRGSNSGDGRNWKLIWADEFDYEGAPNPDKWNIELWDAAKVNNEDQVYTDRQKNVRVANGTLILQAHREDYGNGKYTSARIQSKGKGDFLYGRVDIRAKPPAGQGTWSALWMLPSDAHRYATHCTSDDDGHGSLGCDAWPNSGEIDIMEHVGYDMTRVHSTVHNYAYYEKNKNQRQGTVEVPAIDKAFHVYSLEWTPQAITVFCDGSPYFSYVNEGAGWQAWPYDHAYYIIMNLAIGGWWGRAGGPIDDSIFPVSMEIDYVRVFKPAM